MWRSRKIRPSPRCRPPGRRRVVRGEARDEQAAEHAARQGFACGEVAPRRSGAGSRSGRGCPPARPRRSPRRAQPRSSATGFSQNAGSPARAASSQHRDVRGRGRRDHERVDAARRRDPPASPRRDAQLTESAWVRAWSASQTMTDSMPASDSERANVKAPIRPAPMTPMRRAGPLVLLLVSGAIGKRLQ